MFIYTLSDPDTNEIRYIGKTKNIENRYNRHIQKCYLDKYGKNTYKSNWIKSLIKINKKPIIEILDEGDKYNINDLEIYWISQFKSWGFRLTNMSEGGEIGVDWTGRKHSILSKERMRNSHNIRNKNIVHYNLDGSIINKYISLSDASIKTKNHISLISNCCKKKGSYTVGGKHFWRENKGEYPTTFRYENDPFDYQPYNKNIQINSKSICKYNLDGYLIDIYDSLRNAAFENNTNKSNISSCCKKKISKKTGKFIIVKGYTWRYFDETKGEKLTIL